MSTAPSDRSLFLPLIWSTICSVLGLPAIASGASFTEQFIDPEDGWLDAGDWVLNNAVGFLPLPFVITEPAVGEGVGLAVGFFHPPKEYDSSGVSSPKGRNGSDAGESDFVLPNITGIAAAVTNNNSWFLGGAHIAHWKDDTIRYEGVLGYASLNLEFFGVSDQIGIDQGIRFTGEGFFVDQPIAFRLRDSNFFWGVGYKFLDIETETDASALIPPDIVDLIPPEYRRLNLDTQLSALAAFVQYDTLDNSFTPNSGREVQVKIARNDEAIGSDWDFTNVEAYAHQFWALNQKLVLGLRLDYESVHGDVPFFSLPFVDLRGIPAMRFQGEHIAVGESELRWAFHPRISAVGFIGLGRAAASFSDLGDAGSRVTRGIGIRYYAARKLGLHAGFDVARGPDETHWYLTFGQAW